MLRADKGIFSVWAEAQRQWWENWFAFAQGASASNLQLLQRSTQQALEAQQAFYPVQAPPSETIADTFGSQMLTHPVKLELGASASLTKTVTDQDVVAFAEVSGDTNPVHLSDAYAAQTRFGGRIAHGMLSAGFISAVLGTKLPGPGAVYLSQTLKFRAPVKLGDEITATATVIEVKEGKPIFTLETVCTNQNGEKVLEGEAVILFDPVVPQA